VEHFNVLYRGLTKQDSNIILYNKYTYTKQVILHFKTTLLVMFWRENQFDAISNNIQNICRWNTCVHDAPKISVSFYFVLSRS